MDWKTTSLGAGPLTGNTYNCNIPQLSASTIYEYRAYVVICGTQYYGDVQTGCTLAIQTVAPNVCTGIAYGIVQEKMSICNNKVLDNGGLPIAEYGFLYTQNSSYGNNNCLVLGAYPAKVCKKSTPANIEVGASYYTGTTNEMTGLVPNTQTYFRAFARNASGVGYGDIKTAITLANPVELFFDSIVGGFNDTVTIAANNLVLQTMTIVFEYHIEATVDNNYDDPGTYDNKAITKLEISLDGGSTWTTIDTVTAECSEQQCSDYDESDGIYTINGINATNISLVRIRALRDCDDSRSYKNGYINIKILETSTIDSGELIILPDKDEFERDCHSEPFIS